MFLYFSLSALPVTAAAGIVVSLASVDLVAALHKITALNRASMCLGKTFQHSLSPA